ADRELAAAQLLDTEIRRLIRILLDDAIDPRGAADPLPERLPGSEQVLHRVIAMEAGGLEIDADALARADAALGDDLVLADLHHAGLGADDEQAGPGHRVAQRTQAVAVEARDHPATVGRGDRRRPVPGLHHCVAV